MNDLFFRLRCAGMALGLASLLCSSVAWAQTNIPRQADFIVAVVNSEPITNQEVRTASQRLQREAVAQGRPLDEAKAKSLALEQLINDKAQIQQAREAGIKIDSEAIDQAEGMDGATVAWIREQAAMLGVGSKPWLAIPPATGDVSAGFRNTTGNGRASSMRGRPC